MMIMIKVILVCVCLYAHIVDSFQKRFIQRPSNIIYSGVLPTQPQLKRTIFRLKQNMASRSLGIRLNGTEDHSRMPGQQWKSPQLVGQEAQPAQKSGENHGAGCSGQCSRALVSKLFVLRVCIYLRVFLYLSIHLFLYFDAYLNIDMAPV